MGKTEKTESEGRSIVDLFAEQYLEEEDRGELNYWESLARMIMETIESRHAQGLSQEDLARRAKTKQSVISRFENMGRKPSYDFVARLSRAMGHVAGMTLYGEYMAVVPREKHQSVAEMAIAKGVSTQKFVEQLLTNAIAQSEVESSISSRVFDTTVDLEWTTPDVTTESAIFSLPVGSVSQPAEIVWLRSGTVGLFQDVIRREAPDIRRGSFQQLTASEEDSDEIFSGSLSAAGTYPDRKTA